MLIGIAGGSGSGKSTLADELSRSLDTAVTVLRHDDYYKSRRGMSLEERSALNYDEPDAFDNELFVSHLDQLKRGEAVEGTIYDYAVHDRSDRTRRIEPSPVILAEGILLFAEERVSSRFDLRIFVDTDADIRLIRRIRRDTETRGRTAESVMRQWEDTVKPMHDRYVQPSIARADLVIPGGGRNPVVLEVLLSRIRAECASARV